MYNYFIQLVLAGSNRNSESLVDILIVAFFIVAWIIRNVFLGQKQQNQQKNRPASNRPIQRTSVSSQKAQTQKDRVEQFLESILQTKKHSQQHHPARSSIPKPQPVVVSNQSKVNISSVPADKVSLNKAVSSVKNAQAISQSQNNLNSEEALGVSIMELPSIDTAINTKLEHIPELKEEHIQEDQVHLIYHKKPQQASGKSSLPFLAVFSDSDDLKRAILYTEILGKPVSIRESQSIY